MIFAGLGAFFGGCVRHLAGQALRGADFPAATLAVNAAASFFAGFMAGLGRARSVPEGARLFFAAGFCGGLSTFSTFSVETLGFLESGKYARAGLNAGLNLVVSLACAAAGAAAGRRWE
ncbi:MAG: CrcB family protein [Clostridiales bacterium]|jgi:CrcB protein|nr:CrcB family protein [Clostridiales bacterium]